MENAGGRQVIALEIERHAAARGQRSGGAAPGEVPFEPDAPIPVEAVPEHGRVGQEKGVVVEDGRQSEGRPVVPGPDIGESRLEAEIGVIELGLELMLALLVVGQPGLDGQDADVAGSGR